jgi:hypothetical protein
MIIKFTNAAFGLVVLNNATAIINGWVIANTYIMPSD